MVTVAQNKKRKYNRDHVDRDRDDRDRTPEEPEDPLKDATTLYVGNLYGTFPTSRETVKDGSEAYNGFFRIAGPSTPPRSRSTNCSPSKSRLFLHSCLDSAVKLMMLP